MKVSRRIEAVLLTCFLACFGALGLRSATLGASGFDPASATVGNARLLALAVTQYEQNNDEYLPPTDTQAHFQAALLPFVQDPLVFISPETGKPFLPNPAISHLQITQFSDLGTVVIFQDAPPPGLAPVIAFLDQHIERNGIEQGNPDLIVYYRARQVAFGVIQYTQDSNGILPPMQNPAAFQAAVYPYTHSHRVFYSPNGKPFIPNAALSGVALSSINDLAHTVLFQDSPPYVGGIPTIAYVDGHVVHGIFGQKHRSDRNNLDQIGQATIQYTQDNNNNLPPTNSYNAFEMALSPYLSDPSVFVNPATGLPYTLNAAISGLPIFAIADPSTTELARDSRLNQDGSLNILYVDGHVRMELYFIPQGVLTTPDDDTRLFWRKVGDEAALWTLTPSGDTLSENSYTLDQNGKPIAFSVGGDNKTRLLGSRFFPVGAFVVPITGAITLDTIASDNSVENTRRYGPYDGWTPLFLATAPDNTSRLLWERYDGTFALWRVSPEGEYLGDVRFPALPNITPVGMARGSDDRTRVLGQTTDGGATLLTLSSRDQIQEVATFHPHSGYAVTALALGADNKPRLLWDNGHGQAEVWTLTPDGQFLNFVRFSLASGYTASQLTVGQAGDLRVLWTASDGSGRLQTLHSNGTVINVRDLTPYQ